MPLVRARPFSAVALVRGISNIDIAVMVKALLLSTLILKIQNIRDSEFGTLGGLVSDAFAERSDFRAQCCHPTTTTIITKLINIEVPHLQY